MLGAYAIIGVNAGIIMLLHALESKGMDIEWEWYGLGLMLQVSYALLKFGEKLLHFL
jgi:hypothetical protein